MASLPFAGVRRLKRNFLMALLFRVFQQGHQFSPRLFVLGRAYATRVHASPVKEVIRVLIKHSVRNKLCHQQGQTLIVAVKVIKEERRCLLCGLGDPLAPRQAIYFVKQFMLQFSDLAPSAGF
jgi:hypothetical protein